MNIQTIEMPKAEALAAFRDYRRAVRERHSDEDAQIMRGYRTLSQGHQVLNLYDAIIRGGFDREGRPMLAVVRADAEFCHLRIDSDGEMWMTNDGDTWRRRHANRFHWPVGTAPTRTDGRGTFRAMTPLIPPALRPKGRIGRFHVLFEAEWKGDPPRDPALLRHIGGDLYAVVAVWNLTELERTVLAGRSRG